MVIKVARIRQITVLRALNDCAIIVCLTCGVKACTAVARGEKSSAAVAPIESPSMSTLL